METYMREWLALYESKSGERGMFNRKYADEQVAKNGRRQTGHMWVLIHVVRLFLDHISSVICQRL